MISETLSIRTRYHLLAAAWPSTALRSVEERRHGGACEGSETSRAALVEGARAPPPRRHGPVQSFMAARHVIHYVKKNWLYNI